jgi:hypothetical protein
VQPDSNDSNDISKAWRIGFSPGRANGLLCPAAYRHMRVPASSIAARSVSEFAVAYRSKK